MKKFILFSICLLIVGCSQKETYQLSTPKLEQDYDDGVFTIKAIYRNVSNENCSPYVYVNVKSGTLTYEEIMTSDDPIAPNEEAELYGYCPECSNLDIDSIEMTYGDVFCSSIK